MKKIVAFVAVCLIGTSALFAQTNAGCTPTAMFGGLQAGNLPAAVAQKQTSLAVTCGKETATAYHITGFTMSFMQKGKDVQTLTSSTGTFSDEQKKQIKQLVAGDAFSIENIKATDASKKSVNLNSVYIKVVN